MKSINDINYIEIALRKILIEQSEVDGEFVRNALSVFGTTTDYAVGEDIFNSISHQHALIIFELQLSNTTDVTETVEGGYTRVEQSFNAHITIYGDECKSVSNRLVARLRSDAVRNKLHDDGLHLISASTPTCIFEYKNDTMWLRCDFGIELGCKMLIKEITRPDEAMIINGLEINTI